MSEAADGDIATGDAVVGSPGRAASVHTRGPLGDAPEPWTALDQVHGSDVVVVDVPGAGSGTVADAAVTATAGAALSIRVADCVPVALLGHSAVAVAHAGWRGLVDGVLEASVAALSAVDVPGATVAEAVVGPHVGPCCYEFGLDDRARLVELFGPTVAARTDDGRPALDLAAAVSVVLGRHGIPATVDGACTSCDDRHWSYRATGTTNRQAMLVWMDAPEEFA